MKKFILRLRNRILTLWLMSHALWSCSSTRSTPIVQSSDTLMLLKQGFCDQVKAERLELRDKDSVIIRERTVHDTVYVTKEVYRDRLKATGEIREVVRIDTVVVTEWREKIIEKPPRKYVPKFYKQCTVYFWCTIVLFVIYIVFRLTKGQFNKSKLFKF